MSNYDASNLPILTSTLPVTISGQLSRRDTFAIHALQGLLSGSSRWATSNHSIVVTAAVEIANSLIIELDKNINK